MASIKIRSVGIGTFMVTCNGTAVATGLTRDQAECFVAVLGWIA